MSRGELFQTGHPVYDQYFNTVHDLHVLTATGEIEERDARTTLATMLNLLPMAPAPQVLRKLRERADSLPRMQMVIREPGKGPPTYGAMHGRGRQRVAIKLLDRERPARESKDLVTVLQATVSADLDLAARMAEIPERSHRMRSVGRKLQQGMGQEFANLPPAQRERINHELQASLTVLLGTARSSQAVRERLQKFVSAVQEIVDGTKDNKAKAGSGNRGARRAPRPAAEPKMPEDFNP